MSRIPCFLALLWACSGKPDDDETDVDGDGFASADAGGSDCDDDDDAINPDAEEVCDEVDNNCDGAVDEEVAGTWYTDADGDGHGDPLSEVQACTAPAGSVEVGDDCDDTDSAVIGALDWFPDADGDGFGDDDEAVAACQPEPGLIGEGGDCDDLNPTIHPDADEVCDDIDNDCDADIDDQDDDLIGGELYFDDEDGDGFGDPIDSFTSCLVPTVGVDNDLDCDDWDNLVNPDATERCDGIDNDCDELIDDDDSGVMGTSVFFEDGDGDGYGGNSIAACDQPSGTITVGNDCDDTNAAVHPAMDEYCDGVDEDCNGLVDDNAIDGDVWYRDNDNDTYGTSASTRNFCPTDPPLTGWVSNTDDCDDARSTVYPGADEIRDFQDNDCDGDIDDADSDVVLRDVYADSDGDGAGDPGNTTPACTVIPTGYVANDTDCDDSDATIRPGAAEVCDGIDQNCNDTIDEGIAFDSFIDSDNDGYGDPSDWVTECSTPSGYAANNQDCDDDDDMINPAATEIFYDGIDQDCDYKSDYDADLDGWVSDAYGGFDCDDAESLAHPYEYEDPTDGIDNDCDGAADAADPETPVALTLADDDSAPITFASVVFPFCGTDWTSAYVISNGRVMLGTDNTEYYATEEEFAGETSVAALWTDLNPSSGGSVEWIEYSDAVGIYWRGVPLYSGAARVTVAVVLFDDGTVVTDLDSATIDSRTIVGWSCGTGDTAGTDLSQAVRIEDSLGLGMGTESQVHEYFETSPIDLSGAYPFCVQSGSDSDGDGWTPECGDPDDSDSSVIP